MAQATQLQFAKRVVVSGAALVFYDYALTFSAEISEIWNSRYSGAQALFFMTRYSYVFQTMFYCIFNFVQNPSETLCRVTEVNTRIWFTMTEIGLYGILILRTYAIYQKSQFILVILGVTGVANVAISVYVGVVAKSEVGRIVFGSICGINSVSVIPRIQLAGTVISLIFDVLVFTLTFTKTIHHAIEMRKVGLRNGLGYFILRDGALYFLAKLLIGVVATTVFVVPASGSIGTWLEVVVSISNPLTIVLINRLVLNLRQVSHLQERNAPTLGTIFTIQEPAFATNSLLGNLGAPLRVGSEDDDEMEEMRVDDEVEFVEEHRTVDH